MDFHLRAFNLQDADSLARYANNPQIAANLRNVFPHPYTREDAIAYIKGCIKADEKRQLCRVIEIEGEAAGSIGIFLGSDVYEKSAELGYWLGEPFWNRGVMSRAVEELCSEAFLRCGIIRIFAEPYARNTASQRVLEKCGFVLEGVLSKNVYKNGESLDSCLYAMVR